MFSVCKFYQLSKSLTMILVLLNSNFAFSGRIAIDVDSLLGDEIPAVLSMPENVSSTSPVPACIVLHGSGGLFREDAPGEFCTANLESNYAEIFDLLESLGVAVIAPDSFGRDSKFCEDNDAGYMPFAPPPFFNDGDGEPVRSDAYRTRRIQTRVLDAGGALKYLHGLDAIDSENICVIGTSNGASAALVLAANGTGRHAAQFPNINAQRPLESDSQFNERKDAFSNYPQLPSDTEDQFLNLPVLKFGQAISPGCFLWKMIPTESPNNVSVVQFPDDFFHPEDGREGYLPTKIYAEMGGSDGVPDHCRVNGVRHIQAKAYEAAFQISPPRWLPTEYPGFGHDLVRDNPEVLAKTKELVIDHFYRISKHGFD